MVIQCRQYRVLGPQTRFRSVYSRCKIRQQEIGGSLCGLRRFLITFYVDNLLRFSRGICTTICLNSRFQGIVNKAQHRTAQLSNTYIRCSIAVIKYFIRILYSVRTTVPSQASFSLGSVLVLCEHDG